MDSHGYSRGQDQWLTRQHAAAEQPAAEFWSEPLPLQPGGNPIEIIAANAAHAETKVVFLVRYTPKPAPVAPKGLSKEEIVSLLHGEVPSARVAELVRERGIKFSPTDADLNQIRAEGGTDELIQAIQQAAAHPIVPFQPISAEMTVGGREQIGGKITNPEGWKKTGEIFPVHPIGPFDS